MAECTVNDVVYAIFTQNDADFYHNKEFNELLCRPANDEFDFEVAVGVAIFKRLVIVLSQIPEWNDTKPTKQSENARKANIIARVATNVRTLADKMGSISILQMSHTLELVAEGYTQTE